MEPTLKEKLVEKGWSEGEAEQARSILYDPVNERKHLDVRKSVNTTHYWLTIIALAVLNLLISIVLVPVLIVFKPVAVNLIVLTVGLLFGFLFNFLIRDIEHVDTEHHIVAASFIPVTAIINIFVVTAVAESFAIKFRIDITQHPIILSLIYVIAFLSPYIFEVLQSILLKKGILQKKLY